MITILVVDDAALLLRISAEVKWEKDKRVNVNTAISDSVTIFLTLVVVNGLHSGIVATIQENANISVQFLINAMIGWLVFSALVLTALFGLYRYYYLNRPMRRLSEAAKKVAVGDFSVRVAPLRKDGKKDYIEVMFDDFNTMAKELESIETLKNDFIANVSHEIKTPLSIIQSYAAALQSDALEPDDRHEYIKTIVASSQKLSSLVSSILKLSKLVKKVLELTGAEITVESQRGKGTVFTVRLKAD
jgi:signal transduction histidine kinase